MSLHLLKPALRVNDLYEFSQKQKAYWMEHKGSLVYPVWTSRKPQREKELLDGGSLYWIIKKQIMCRQSILDIVPYQEKGAEKASYLILCDATLIRTRAAKKNPFQGWRYLEGEKAPIDSGMIQIDENAPPPELEKKLREAGLL